VPFTDVQLVTPSHQDEQACRADAGQLADADRELRDTP
jgi:hypothetical protein